MSNPQKPPAMLHPTWPLALVAGIIWLKVSKKGFFAIDEEE